jgi:NAD(P)-dependent dehydrogenase (short-subunit alcohol dehydrogenase family)
MIITMNIRSSPSPGERLTEGRSKLEVRAAIVTGAAQGLGLALVGALAQRGSDVLMVDVNASQLDAASATVREAADRTVLTFVADVTNAADLEAAAVRAKDAFGNIHLAANVAGVIGPANRPIWEIPAAEVQRVLEINLGGVLNGVRAFLPLLIEHGQPAALINMASMAGFTASGVRAPYTISKHAVVGLTDVLRCQLAEHHPQVRAMLVAPGPVTTPLLEAAQQQGDWRTDVPTIEPAVAATRILHALVAREYNVFTHVGSDDRIAPRFAEILEACRVTNALAAHGD